MSAKHLPYINEKTVRSILTEKKAFTLAHDVFRLIDQRKTAMPPKVYLDLPGSNDFRAMPAFINSGKNSACGIKWVSVFPENRGKGLPTVNATVLLNSTTDSRLLAVLEANALTAIRTGAAAAVASRYMARPSSQVLTIVGAGLQAEYQLRAIAPLFKLKEIWVWGFLPHEAPGLCRRLSGEFKNLKPCSDLRKGVSDADILVTCTPSRKPLIRSAWVKKGTHINAMGADAHGKEELEPALVLRSKVVVDEWEQASHSGEINVPVSKKLFSKKNLYASLAEIVAGKKKGRSTSSEITIFDSTGLAVLDIYFADYVYRRLSS